MRLALLPFLLLPTWAATGQTDWPGRPSMAPPRLHQKGPPPAWLETPRRSVWLAFGSYCWGTLCVDMIPPSMRKDIPTVVVRRAEAVRVHLAFVPSTAQAVVLRGDNQQTVRLQPKRILAWRPRLAGVSTVDVRGPRGSAGYLFRLRLAAR